MVKMAGGVRVETEIYLAGGCFWGLEALLQKAPCVVSTEVGYANSRRPQPTYEQVCTGATGAAETVKVVHDGTVTGLKRILTVFFEAIDPTSLNRQGFDVGTQYRTGIYYLDEESRHIAEAVLAEESRKYDRPVVTEIMALENFYCAEAYHQDYLKKNPGGYCHLDLSKWDFTKE